MYSHREKFQLNKNRYTLGRLPRDGASIVIPLECIDSNTGVFYLNKFIDYLLKMESEIVIEYDGI